MTGQPRENLRPRSHLGKAALGYLVGAVCLVWVFHDVPVKEVFRNVRTMNWWWVAVAVLFDVFSYTCQGWRWSLLLHPSGSISVLRATQAIYAGLFVNEILPLRAGEVLRTYLASRWLPAGVSFVVSSILAERFFDAVWLAVAVAVTVLLVPLPRYLVNAEEVLAAAVVALAAAFVYIVLRKQESPQAAETAPGARGPIRWVSTALGKLAGGLRDIGRSRWFYASFVVSGLLLWFQILAFWLVMWAYGLRFSFWHGAAVLLIVHLGTAIPSAPSNLGSYQFFTVVGLALFGVEKGVATGFSVLVFLILTIPLWAIGLFAFGRAGLSLRRIRTDIAPLAER